MAETSDTPLCLITGGARGIGRACALAAAARGWNVLISYREREDAAQETVRGVQALGRQALAIKADVGVVSDIEALFKRGDQHFGRLDALVNSAGIAHHNRVDSLNAVELASMFAVNVTGLMLCCREAVRRMSTRQGGRGGGIVNISSMAATIGGRAGSSTYAASKGAVDVFSTGLAKEVAAEGIRVNVVRPGVTDTDMIEPIRTGAARAGIEASIPMGRFGRPEEIAQAVVWLLSRDASFVSGAHLDLSGGGFLIGKP